MTELLDRQQIPERILSHEERQAEELVRDLLTERAPQRQRFALPLRIIGLFVGAAVLAGAVAVATAITTTRHNAHQSTLIAPLALTGAAALRPDALVTQVNGTQQQSSTANTRTTATSSAVSAPLPHTTSQMLVQPSRATPAAKAQNGTVDVNKPTTAVDVVREFYRRVAQDPNSALGLVDPSISAIDQIGFVRSWNSVRAIQPEVIQLRPDNSVLGVVAIQEPDGQWLRVEQVLQLSDGPSPKIINAQVLSAQRNESN